MDLPEQGLKSLKPGVKRGVHLLVAALLWTLAGGMLFARGVIWIDPYENGWLLPLALVLGTFKSVMFLDKSARRSIERIVNMRDGRCLGAVYSWKMWLLILLMMTSGIMLRLYFSPGRYVGLLYAAVGWALLISSRSAWRQWLQWKPSHDLR